MDPYLITILAALIGALSAQAVGYLTHYSSEQRERLSRQYTFKEKQLQNLYAPILAHLVDLVARWELVQHLREDREKLIKSHKLKDFESTEQLRKPVAQYHSDQYAYQLQVLEKVATLAKENIQYAEPDTKKHIKNLFRFFANREVVVKYHIPVDATGEEIPSPIDPFPNWFKEFIKDIEKHYNRLAQELRSAQQNILDGAQNVSDDFPVLLDDEAPIDVDQVQVSFGEKYEVEVFPGKTDDNHEYRVPIVLKNLGRQPIKRYTLRIRVPNSLLPKNVAQGLAVATDEYFTELEIDYKRKPINLAEGEEEQVCTPGFRITPELAKKREQLPEILECTLTNANGTSRIFRLPLATLDLFEAYPEQTIEPSERLDVSEKPEPIAIKVENKDSE